MVHYDIFILILNHTNISIGITWNIERKSCFHDTISRLLNLADSSMELCLRQFPKTGTALKHRDGAVFLDVPVPCSWQGVRPQEPHLSWEKLVCHSRWEWCHLLFNSRGSCCHATPLRFNILVTSITGGGVRQQVLLGSITLSPMQELGTYQVAWLSCEMID